MYCSHVGSMLVASLVVNTSNKEVHDGKACGQRVATPATRTKRKYTCTSFRREWLSDFGRTSGETGRCIFLLKWEWTHCHSALLGCDFLYVGRNHFSQNSTQFCQIQFRVINSSKLFVVLIKVTYIFLFLFLTDRDKYAVVQFIIKSNITAVCAVG